MTHPISRFFGGAGALARVAWGIGLFVAALGVPSTDALAAGNDIGCTGRIVPGDGVVFLSGYPGDIVRAIGVKVGDIVKQGANLMTLDEANLVAERDLAAMALKNITKDAAQRDRVQALTVRLATERKRYAEKTIEQYRSLDRDAISEREQARLEAEFNQANLSLEIEQSRAVQIHADDANQIEAAQKRLEIATTNIGLHVVTAPRDGVVLRIDRHVGERLDGSPAIQLGDLTTMYVVCQVYQGDLLKLSRGMKATIKNAAFATPLAGTVEQISRLVETREQLGEAKIKLDDASPADQLVGMEVEVSIAAAK